MCVWQNACYVIDADWFNWFIKAVREGGEGGYEIHVNAAETQPRGYKSNPATNDWVPNSEEYQVERERERIGLII